MNWMNKAVFYDKLRKKSMEDRKMSFKEQMRKYLE